MRKEQLKDVAKWHEPNFSSLISDECVSPKPKCDFAVVYKKLISSGG
jgi:hypothetical protein